MKFRRLIGTLKCTCSMYSVIAPQAGESGRLQAEPNTSPSALSCGEPRNQFLEEPKQSLLRLAQPIFFFFQSSPVEPASIANMLKIWSMVRRLARARRVGPCAISNAAPYRKRSSRRLRMPRVLQAGRRRRSQLRSCGCRKVCRFACLLHPPCLRPCPALRSLMSSSLSLDLSELSLGSTMRMEFPDPDDILNFTLIIEPDEGMYRGGRFTFEFKINPNFPHEPPRSSASRRSTTPTSTCRERSASISCEKTGSRF